jgi:hypothetical protein
MAYVSVQGFNFPDFVNVTAPLGQGTAGAIDATGEKHAIVGRVWNKDRTTKSIRNVGFRFGTIVKAGGSGLTLSLQNVDLATGPPYQPDGTQDQTVAIANADAGFASNVWYLTGDLSADRSVAFGEHIAVVLEYDGGGRLSTDSVIINGLDISGTSMRPLDSGHLLYTASWAVVAQYPQMVFKFTDGTYGRLTHSLPMTTNTTTNFNSSSGADEIAMTFQFPMAVKVDGAWVMINVTAGGNFDTILYDSDGSTPLATVSTDANAIFSSGTAKWHYVTFPEVTLNANTTYYLAVKPTTTTNVSVYSATYEAAEYRQASPWGESVAWTSRVDAGSWAAETTTRQMMAGLRISAIDIPTGSASTSIGGTSFGFA